MVTKSLEDKITYLLEVSKKQIEINNKQAMEIERLEAAREVENVINNYEYFSEMGRWGDVVGLFAQQTPGVRSEILNWGVYEGIEGIEKLYLGIFKSDTSRADGSGMKPGYFIINTTSTPIIEVAGDGKTAQGLWIVFGAAATPPDFEARWHWLKLGVDFVKESDKWKIWHYHLYGLFETSFYRAWTEKGKHFLSENVPLKRISLAPDELKPNRPTTHPLWWYSTESINDPVPVPPKPYETFDEKTAY